MYFTVSSVFYAIILLQSLACAWIPSTRGRHSRTTTQFASTEPLQMSGSLHGQNACFLPLKQLDQDYFAPRIVQIAGAYPGITREELMAVTSEPVPGKGQWTYDFSDPDGPQLGTVALEGSQVVYDVEDAAVIIAEHTSLGLPLPSVIAEPVDLVVLVDRSKPRFAERKFLVIETPGEGVSIAAFNTKAEMPNGSEILAQVELVQVPWLPSMAPTKTGFMEADEYF